MLQVINLASRNEGLINQVLRYRDYRLADQIGLFISKIKSWKKPALAIAKREAIKIIMFIIFITLLPNVCLILMLIILSLNKQNKQFKYY